MKWASYIIARATSTEGHDEYGRLGFFLEPSWSVFTGDMQSASVAAGSVMAKILSNKHIDFGEQVELCDCFLSVLESGDTDGRLIRAMNMALRQRTKGEQA